MKRAALILLTLFVTVMLVACGGNNAAKGNTSANGEHHEGGDEHGKMTDIGKKKIGDRDVTVAVNEFTASKGEGVAEVELSGDGADKAKVVVWLEQDGKEASPKKTGEWAADEKKFDCHVELKKDMKAGKYKLVVEVDGKKESWDVDVK
jgi:hypothetical protein